MKEKKTAPKKMTLSRETLALLSDKEMKEVLGGITSDRCTYRCTGSVDVCCS